MALSNRLPTGPGSRGGHWHDPEFRRRYHRAWRAAHPDYREHDNLRRARQRARDRGDDPAAVQSSTTRSLPLPAVRCACECGCGESVAAVCGFCRDGLHSA